MPTISRTSTNDVREAWENYWTDGRASGSIGCLPDSSPDMQNAQQQFWMSAIGNIPRKSTVLDLATGDGAVLKMINGIRQDLKLVGVDYASKLPNTRKPIKLRANIGMENLPFPGETVDAVVSRFGVEYGKTLPIAEEIHRVLRPNGVYAFIIHHTGSAIHQTNRSRLEGLDWALNSTDIISRALGYLKARDLLRNNVPDGFSKAVATAVEKFGQSSVAFEFTYAVRDTLQTGWGKPTALCIDIIRQLERHAKAEMKRIDTMIKASKDRAKIQEFVSDLSSAGLTSEIPGLLEVKRQPAPIAWLLHGRKS